MPIADAEFTTGLNITGAVLTVNTKPLFDKGNEVYLKSDLKVAAATNSMIFDFVPMLVNSITAKIFDDGGTTKFESQTNGIAATSSISPVNPDPTGDGNITTVWFYTLTNLSGSSVVYNVPIANLLQKADAKTYFAAQVALL